MSKRKMEGGLASVFRDGLRTRIPVLRVLGLERLTDSSDRPLWVIPASWAANHTLLERNVLAISFPSMMNKIPEHSEPASTWGPSSC